MAERKFEFTNGWYCGLFHIGAGNFIAFYFYIYMLLQRGRNRYANVVRTYREIIMFSFYQYHCLDLFGMIFKKRFQCIKQGFSTVGYIVDHNNYFVIKIKSLTY